MLINGILALLLISDPSVRFGLARMFVLATFGVPLAHAAVAVLCVKNLGAAKDDRKAV